MGTPYWCCARTEPQREAAAGHFLGLAGYASYCPRLKEIRRISGRKVEVFPPLFASYVFIQVTSGWWSARWCPAVVSLLMDGEQPARLADAIIDDLKSREVGGYIVLPKHKPQPFMKGDAIKIIAGPLSGALALYEGMRSQDRVEVLLGLLRINVVRGAIERA
jgi:transcription antitermination factor NusG